MCRGLQLVAGGASLHALGLHRATDVTAGFEVWRDAGFPVESSEGSSDLG